MNEDAIVVEVPKPHQAQRQVLKERRRFNVLNCGRRFGKTKLGIRLIVKHAAAGLPVAWFAPTYKTLDEPWREVKKRLEPVIASADANIRRIETVTGGLVKFWSLDNPDAGRGDKYAGVVIDEAAMVRRLEEAWQQSVRPTLTDLQGWAWFLSTPKGINFFKELYDMGQDPAHPEWQSWTMPTLANPYIPPQEIEAARRDVLRVVFLQEYEAQFLDMSGGILRHEWLQTGEPPPGLRLYMGVDLAISEKESADYTAAVVLGIDPEGRIFVVHAERIRAQFHGVMEFIKGLAARFNPVLIGVETVQYQAAVVQELVRTTKLPVQGVRVERDKVTRFGVLATRYMHKLVYHSKALPEDFRREVLAFPEGDHDDYVDALVHAYDIAQRGAVVWGVKGTRAGGGYAAAQRKAGMK